MADSPMPTFLFVSVFVLLFFKFCLGAPQLGPAGAHGPLADLVALGHTNHPAAGAEDSRVNMAADATPPLPLVRKCPVGTVFSVAVGGCKDLVRSTKDHTQRMELLMPYLLAASQQLQPMPR